MLKTFALNVAIHLRCFRQLQSICDFYIAFNASGNHGVFGFDIGENLGAVFHGQHFAGFNVSTNRAFYHYIALGREIAFHAY